MSDFKRPRSTVPSDDYYYIDDDLVELVDFEEELDEYEINEFDESESAIVDNYDNYIDVNQLNEDAMSSYITTYKPPQIIRVLSKTVRTTAAGQIVLDYELEIEEVAGAKSYEIRVLEQ